MFKKVLLVDDLTSINEGVVATLQNLGITDYSQVLYCDDAHLKIKRAFKDKVPYDLLITDLFFKPDYREQRLISGEDLVTALKKEFPKLKVIVYSVDDRLQMVRNLVHKSGADAFVCKGRQGLMELEEAIQSVFNDNLYLSPQIAKALTNKQDLEITDYDMELLRLLSFGHSKYYISDFFKEKGISPNSVSSIEKRQNRLLVKFKATNAIHLISIVKDLGVI